MLPAALIAALLPLAVGAGGRHAGSDTDAFAATAVPEWEPGRGLRGFSDIAFVNGGDGSRWDIGVDVADTVTWARAAGANSHRITAAWSSIEPRPGAVRHDVLGRLRRLADGFTAHGGRVLVTLAFAPNWARDPIRGCPSCHGPPAERPETLAAWDRYVERVVRAFPNAAAFEVWNEPNFRFFWSPRPDPARYARLVRRTAAVLRRTAPDAKVLAGSLLAVPDDVPGQGIMRSSTFLGQAFAAGLRGSYDAISWHAYPAQYGGQMEDLDADSTFRRSLTDVQVAIDAVDPGARRWVTETGVTTSGDGYGVSADAQRTGLARILTVLSADPRIDAVYVHRLFDTPAYPVTSREHGFGIVTPGGGGTIRAKPAFCMLRAAANARTHDPSGRCPQVGGDRARAPGDRAARRRARAKRRRARARAEHRARVERRARAERRAATRRR